jgi:predicted GIY-YIG superfamily endonuclease
MSFSVYILRCADNSYYTGHTDNLVERIEKHKRGLIEGYTSTRLPVRLVFSEHFPTREEALASERQIKGWTRKKKEALMRSDWPEVSRLARKAQPSNSVGRQLQRGGVLVPSFVHPSTSSGRTESKK